VSSDIDPWRLLIEAPRVMEIGQQRLSSGKLAPQIDVAST
jgi:hypothetical protein